MPCYQLCRLADWWGQGREMGAVRGGQVGFVDRRSWWLRTWTTSPKVLILTLLAFSPGKHLVEELPALSKKVTIVKEIQTLVRKALTGSGPIN